MSYLREQHMEEQVRAAEQADEDLLPGHSEECQLNCCHCQDFHGRDCWRTCCWCSAVYDGEGVPVDLECTCEASDDKA